MTILLLKDYQKYPNCIVDYETRNKSAIELASKLKLMSIKNHLFFLTLLNPRLQGVDPFDPNLTMEQMAWVALEARTNPWYFLREIARVPSRAGISNNFLTLNRSNICLWWCFLNRIVTILTQPRQTGKSLAADLLMTWLYNFACNNTQINLMTKDDTLRTDNIKRLKDIYEELPSYLKLKTRDDVNNTEEISIRRLNNTYRTHVPASSEKAAYNKGRGMTTPIFHIDEGPFQRYISIALPVALAAMGAAIDNARANNTHYGIIYTTTAGKKDDVDGRYFYSIIQESALFTEKFYDAQDEQELRRIICTNSRATRNAQSLGLEEGENTFKGVYQVYAVFDHRQLGHDDKWLLEQLERTHAKGEDANRDFFNIWTSGSQSSPLSPHLLDMLRNSSVPSDHQSIAKIGSYIQRWYMPEEDISEFMAQRHVICGIDSSDASGGDDIGMVFTDAKTGGVVCAGNFNKTNLIVFAKWLVSMMVEYPKLIMVIERRSSGATILDYLLLFLPQYGIDPFKRIFNWVVNDPNENPQRWQEVNVSLGRRSEHIYDKTKKEFGFATSGSGKTSRSSLYSTTLQNAVKRCGTKVYDRTLIQQILNLITKNGRIDHPDGEHDDLVIAWLLTHWFLTTAKNLSYYGIDSSKILVQEKEIDYSTPEQAYTNQEQMRLRERMQELLQQLKEETDPLISNRYENALRAIERDLVLEENEDFSLDATLKEIKASKRKTRISTTNTAYGMHYNYTNVNAVHNSAREFNYRDELQARRFDPNVKIIQ